MGESFIVAAPRLEEFFEIPSGGSVAYDLSTDALRMLGLLTHGLPERQLAKIEDERLRDLCGSWRDEPWVIAGGYESADNYREFFSARHGKNVWEEAHYRESGFDHYSWSDIRYGLIALWTEIDSTYPNLLTETSAVHTESQFLALFGFVALRYQSPALSEWLEKNFGQDWAIHFEKIRESRRKRHFRHNGTPYL